MTGRQRRPPLFHHGDVRTEKKIEDAASPCGEVLTEVHHGALMQEDGNFQHWTSTMYHHSLLAKLISAVITSVRENESCLLVSFTRSDGEVNIGRLQTSNAL